MVAIRAGKDGAAAAAGRVVSQECAFVVEKAFARVYAENETQEAVVCMEGLGEMVQEDC